MASKMDAIFKEYYSYVRTSSGQAEIFKIGPEKSVEHHTNTEDTKWPSTATSSSVLENSPGAFQEI